MHDSSQTRVYLDYAATAPFDERLAPVLVNASWANANALYTEGRQAAEQLKNARTRIAKALGAHAPQEIIFTSGGTESCNAAIKGLVKAASHADKTHVIVSALEHPAVIKTADSLRSSGFKIDMIEPGPNGLIQVSKLEELLSSIEAAGDTAGLVCIQAVNNEVGLIQEVSALAQSAHEHGSLFFCDAVQALGKLDLDLEGMQVDACALSGHKIGAPKGIGCLYMKRGLRMQPLLHGGGQETGMRSGTSNVAGAATFAAAIEFATKERVSNWDHARYLHDHLLEGIACLQTPHSIYPVLQPNASVVPHICAFIVDGLEGETMVLRADNAGFAISSGSACSSRSLDPSHVLVALGVPKDRAYGGIRISYGPHTTIEDIDALLSALPEVLR